MSGIGRSGIILGTIGGVIAAPFVGSWLANKLVDWLNDRSARRKSPQTLKDKDIETRNLQTSFVALRENALEYEYTRIFGKAIGAADSLNVNPVLTRAPNGVLHSDIRATYTFNGSLRNENVSVTEISMAHETSSCEEMTLACDSWILSIQFAIQGVRDGSSCTLTVRETVNGPTYAPSEEARYRAYSSPDYNISCTGASKNSMIGGKQSAEVVARGYIEPLFTEIAKQAKTY
ncbi:MAG: hypothetical protein HYT76_10150 [Deltaproteobacteria bacterium]|nr:hypothetical protein [Deltaproteobacteria bacterium]